MVHQGLGKGVLGLSLLTNSHKPLLPGPEFPSWVTLEKGLAPQAGWAQCPEMHSCCHAVALATHLPLWGLVSHQVTLHTHSCPFLAAPSLTPTEAPSHFSQEEREGTEAMRKLVLRRPLGTSHW